VLIGPTTLLEVVGSEVVGSEVVGSEVVGSEVVGSEVVGSEVVGSFDGMLVGSFDSMLVGSFDGMLVGSFDSMLDRAQIGAASAVALPGSCALKCTCGSSPAKGLSMSVHPFR